MVFQSFNLYPHMTVLAQYHAGADQGQRSWPSVEAEEIGGRAVGRELAFPTRLSVYPAKFYPAANSSA